MNDITWIAEEDSVEEVVRRLEICAAASLVSEYANRNQARSETSKTEANMLLSCKRRDWRARAEESIPLDTQTVRFAQDATILLGVWLGSALALREN